MGTINIQSITAAFALIFFVPLASSFQLCVNFNQFSSQMVTKADEWAAARVQTSCALGFGADNDDDPMSDEQRLELARMYKGKPITQTASWQVSFNTKPSIQVDISKHILDKITVLLCTLQTHYNDECTALST